MVMVNWVYFKKTAVQLIKKLAFAIKLEVASQPTTPYTPSKPGVHSRHLSTRWSVNCEAEAHKLVFFNYYYYYFLFSGTTSHTHSAQQQAELGPRNQAGNRP